MTVRVLLVDDVVDVRRMLRTTLRLRGGFEVVGEAGDGAEAVRLAESEHPDVVILDLGLPDIAGREVLTRIRECSPDAKVVVFSGADTTDRDWISQHVEGFVLKDTELDYLVDLLQTVSRPQHAESVMDLPHDVCSRAFRKTFARGAHDTIPRPAPQPIQSLAAVLMDGLHGYLEHD